MAILAQSAISSRLLIAVGGAAKCSVWWLNIGDNLKGRVRRGEPPRLISFTCYEEYLASQ